MSLYLSESMIAAVVNELKDLSGLISVYVHGSVAKGTSRPDSDLDLALLFRYDAAVDRIVLMQIEGELESVLKVPVHIGILDRNSLVYAKEVIANGKRIYCTDSKNCDIFAMYCLAGYAELNEQRQRVIDSYRA